MTTQNAQRWCRTTELHFRVGAFSFINLDWRFPHGT